MHPRAARLTSRTPSPSPPPGLFPLLHQLKFAQPKPFRFSNLQAYWPLALAEAVKAAAFAYAFGVAKVSPHAHVLAAALAAVLVSIPEGMRISGARGGQPLVGAMGASTLTLRVVPWVTLGCLSVLVLEVRASQHAALALCLGAVADATAHVQRQRLAQASDFSPVTAVLYSQLLSFLLALVVAAGPTSQLADAWAPLWALAGWQRASFVAMALAGAAALFAGWQLAGTVPATALATLASAKRSVVLALYLFGTASAANRISVFALLVSLPLAAMLLRGLLDLPPFASYASAAAGTAAAGVTGAAGAASRATGVSLEDGVRGGDLSGDDAEATVLVGQKAAS